MKVSTLILSTVKKEVKKLAKAPNYIDTVTFTNKDENTLVMAVVGYPSDIETTLTLQVRLSQDFHLEQNFEYQIDVIYSVDSAFFGKGMSQFFNNDYINFDIARITELINNVYKYNN